MLFRSAGRLTRKERAAYIIRSHRSVNLSTYSVKVDYAAGHKIMRFGDVGLKIFLVMRQPEVPVYYALRFITQVKKA